MRSQVHCSFLAIDENLEQLISAIDPMVFIEAEDGNEEQDEEEFRRDESESIS